MIQTGFKTFATPDYDVIRLADPFDRRAANWHRLPAAGLMVRPTPTERRALERALACSTPPGPPYRQLIDEIWARGFEVFVVGGAVRDAFVGAVPRNVNVVTTMPLDLLLPLFQSMYGAPPSLDASARTEGTLRLGVLPEASDPPLDVSVFRHRTRPTADTLFADCFASDVAFRDFACNAVYYEPVNDVLIDPSGFGIDDAVERRLRMVGDVRLQTPHERGELAVRYCRFRRQGYQSVDCDPQIARDFVPMLREMSPVHRIGYFRTQVFFGLAVPDQHAAFEATERIFHELGLTAIWHEVWAPIRSEILTP